MALAIDNVVPGFRSYKDVWSAGIDSKLPCSPGSAIVKAGMPLHTQAPINSNPHVMLLIIVVIINFRRKAIPRNLFSKKKAFSKYPKINSLRN